MKPAPKPAAVVGDLVAVEAAALAVAAAVVVVVLAAAVVAEEEAAIAVVVVAVADTRKFTNKKDAGSQPASFFILLRRLILHKLYLRLVRDNASLIAHIQKLHHSPFSVFSVIQRAVVYIHS